MNNSKLLLVATAMITLVACNAAQKERIKEVGSVACLLYTSDAADE